MRLRALAFAAFVFALPLHAAGHRRAVRPAVNGMGDVRHIVEIILENTDAPAAIRQPFLAEIAARGALLTNYHALTHPSQPNYIAMFAGNTYGITISDPVTLNVEHLADLLEQRGLTWKVYAEGFPGNCFLGATSGNYVRRHVPFLSYANVQSNPTRCAAIVDATAFDADVASRSLPQFALYIPDLRNDGHDTGVAFADTWLRSRFGPLMANEQLVRDTLFIVVFDEGSESGPNVVYCAFAGAGVVAGVTDDDLYDHYSLLRTIEQIFQLGSLHQHDKDAKVISRIWRR